MRKFALCTVLLFVGMPLLAKLSIDATGGFKLMIPEENAKSETYPVIGITANYSIPKMPISIRESFEYGHGSWIPTNIDGNLTDVNATLKTILLAVQYNIEMPSAPVSFYIGAGPEMVIFDSSERLGDIIYSFDYTDEGALIYAGGSVNMGVISLFTEAGFGMFFETLATNHVPINGGIKFNL